MSASRTQTGFTLVELVVTLAVAAIVLAIGAPALGEMASRLAARSALADIQGHIAYARMAAVGRNEAVTLCPSADGRTCSSSNQWSRGWIVFADPMHASQPASPVTVLRHAEGVADRVRLQSSAGRVRIRFLPTGWASGTNLTFHACVGRLSLGRVIVNNAGRARAEGGEMPCPRA